MPLPFSFSSYGMDEMEERLKELISINGLNEGTVYLQITRGEAPRSHAFPKDTTPVELAFTNGYARPLQSMQRGIRAITMDDIRWLRCDIKSLNLLPNTMAKQHALDRGVDEAIMHRRGTVTECSASNLLIVQNDTVYSHPADNLILHGVTRAVIIRLAGQLGIPFKEEAFHIDTLYGADEVFITGTTVEITPVVEVDGRQIGTGAPGSLTKRLQEAFESLIRQS